MESGIGHVSMNVYIYIDCEWMQNDVLWMCKEDTTRSLSILQVVYALCMEEAGKDKMIEFRSRTTYINQGPFVDRPISV